MAKFVFAILASVVLGIEYVGERGVQEAMSPGAEAILLWLRMQVPRKSGKKEQMLASRLWRKLSGQSWQCSPIFGTRLCAFGWTTLSVHTVELAV